MVLAWTYAVCVNFVPAYRDPADKIGDSDLGLAERHLEAGDKKPESIEEKTEDVNDR
jgi:MFS transporter, FHS family, L-fucose permease